jgi:LIVCS family branched-chain amino acid:cation transporter
MSKLQSNTISTGLAMFSMFFGAGNVVFPLATGQYAQDQVFYAILGLLITAVGVPFLGLIAMTLFDGNYKLFFERIGKVPGFLISLFIMGLIGPFGALPRVIALSFSTANMFLPFLSLPIFSAISCTIVYLLTYKESRILDILGYLLTPILLGSLSILVIKGLMFAPPAIPTEDSSFSIFLHGLTQGYNTMDLMGAFFFSSMVILCLKKELLPINQRHIRHLIKMTLKASCIGALLLGITYIGFGYIAAHHSENLANVPQDKMLGSLALNILGPSGGIIAIIAVSLACLTTAIALAAVFAEFVHKDITFERISYPVALVLTLAVTFFMSLLQFSGIMSYLAMVLMWCYPALIVLCIVNILHKLNGFKYVKTPVIIAFLLTLFFY